MSVATFVGPFPRESVVTQVATSDRFKIVAGAAALAIALATPPNAVPAVYFCVQESFSRNGGMTGLLKQQATVNIQAVVWAKNYGREQTGEAVSSDMTELLTELRTKLLNWSPGEGFLPLRISASRDEFFKDGYLVVQELYVSGYRLQVSA